MDDAELLERLRAGDEEAFAQLVRTYHGALVRLARTFVPSEAVAEEVAQDTWAGVVRGIGRFEGRSSLKTWIFTILVNRARTTGSREPRNVGLGVEGDAVGERFSRDGAWIDPPAPWPDDVEERLSAPELADRIRDAIDSLPESQRRVVTLRDVEGLDSKEVCGLLGISEGNQRVLLHRGRSALRERFAGELAERRDS